VETPLLNENLIVKKKMIQKKKQLSLSFSKKRKKKYTEKKTRFLLFLFFLSVKFFLQSENYFGENGTSTYTTIPINQKDLKKDWKKIGKSERG